MSDGATYLYAICRPVDDARLDGMTGVGGAAVRLLPADDLAIAVSTVPLADFDAAPLQQHLEDLSWLERTAREHDAAVQALAALTTTAPLRMATVCRDDAGARARLAELAGRAEDVLARLDGRVEWGVKAFAVVAETAPATASSGTEYLRGRRDALAQRRSALDGAVQQAEDAYRALAAVSVAGHRHRVQDRALSGTDEPMVLNAAFLVDAGRGAEFRATVEELAARAAQQVRLSLTGPWAPYSFAVLDET